MYGSSSNLVRSTHRTVLQAPSAVSPSYTPAPTLGPQGVIRTRTGQRHHRPSPLHAPCRHFPNRPPFGPQFPLQIASTRGRRPAPTQVVSVVPDKKPSTSSPGTVTNFLDATFRSYAERIQTELTHLRAVCTKVMCRERQERDEWRARCLTFKEERDAARVRVRAMLGERESLRGVEAALNANNGEGSQQTRSSVSCGVKRPVSFTGTNISKPENEACRRSSYSPSTSPSSATAVHSDTGRLEEEEEARVYNLLYPSPRTLAFPPFTMSLSPPSHTVPPPQRSRSAGPVLSGSSFTTPDDTRLGNEPTPLPRRFSASEAGDINLDLPPIIPWHSEAHSSGMGRHRSSWPTPTPPFDGLDGSTGQQTSPTEPEPVLDIMYDSKGGQLRCRVCM